MLDFYNTLFSIQVTIVGIGVAAIIAIAQILQSFLIYKNSRKLFEAPAFIAMASVFVGGLLVTGGASLMLAFPSHDFFPNENYCINYILENPIVALIILLTIPLSIILLGWFIYKETRYLVPSEALHFHTDNYDQAAFSEYLKYRYGRPPEEHTVVSTSMILGGEPSEDEKQIIQDGLTNYKKRLVQHAEMRKTNRGAENPLAPIESFIMQAVQRSDTTLLIRSLMALEAIYLKDPSSTQFLSYYCDVIRNSIELASSQGLHTALFHILDSVERVANDVVTNNKLNMLSSILDLMKDIGDVFREKDQETFKKLMGIYRNIGERLFDVEDEMSQERIDDVIRDVSWLGERLIGDMVGLEQTPLMFSGTYETPLSALTNCLWGIGQKFDSHEETQMKDIRIFLDAMYVIARALKENIDYRTLTEADKHVYENQFFSLMHQHETLLNAAIKVGNSRNTCLSLLKIEDFLKLTQESFESYDPEDITSSMFGEDIEVNWHKETLRSVLRMGAQTAYCHDKMPKTDPMLMDKGATYQDMVIKLLEKYGDSGVLDEEGKEVLIKSPPRDGVHDETIAYLRRAGAVLGTSFGLNLDDDK